MKVSATNSALNLLSELQKKGFQRIKIDGEQYDFDSLPSIDKKKKHEKLMK